MKILFFFAVSIFFIAIGISYLISLEKDQRLIIDFLDRQRQNQLPLGKKLYLNWSINEVKAIRHQGIILFVADFALMLVYFGAKNFVMPDIWSKILVVMWSASAFLFLIAGIKAIWICKKLL